MEEVAGESTVLIVSLPTLSTAVPGRSSKFGKLKLEGSVLAITCVFTPP